MNREAWLTELSKLIHPTFRGWAMAPYRLTCGWPCRFALGRKHRAIGECHALESSRAGVHEIFVSPLLDKPLEVAGVVCHEMAHVAAGIPAGHGKDFIKVCKHVGLTRNRATSAAPGKFLEERLGRLVEGLGPYPHSAVLPALKAVKARTSVKLVCPRCGCSVLMGLRWLNSVGPTTCACGGLMAATME